MSGIRGSSKPLWAFCSPLPLHRAGKGSVVDPYLFKVTLSFSRLPVFQRVRRQLRTSTLNLIYRRFRNLRARCDSNAVPLRYPRVSRNSSRSLLGESFGISLNTPPSLCKRNSYRIPSKNMQGTRHVPNWHHQLCSRFRIQKPRFRIQKIAGSICGLVQL